MDTAPNQAPAGETPRAAAEAQNAKGKKMPKAVKTLIRVAIILAVIALGIFLILFIVAKASRYDSIGSMLEHMFTELWLMWQRITA